MSADTASRTAGMPYRSAMRGEVYFSVDVEADGPIPGPYSMLSVGVAVAGRHAERFIPASPDAATFYQELRPISDDYVPDALAVTGTACYGRAPSRRWRCGH